MKLFTKTLLAAAMLAGVAGAAQASIGTGSTAAAEAYLQVYDKTQGLTYTLDLGLSVDNIFANLVNAQTPLNYDLSADANWTTFTTNLDPTNTKFGVVAGHQLKGAWTSLTEPTPTKGAPFLAITTAIKNQTLNINIGFDRDTTQNLSKLVYDTDTIKTGQWSAGNSIGSNTLATLFGTYNAGGADASIPFGTEAPFYTLLTAGTGVTTNLSNYVWAISGQNLTFNVPTNVPLPAAVWMFGAGLLGMLGLNRRKVAA